MGREVWSAYEATISIWELDASYNVVSPAVRELRFSRRLAARPIRRVTKYAQPGLAFEETRSIVIAHEIRISEMFSRKAEQLTPFDTEKKFRLLLQLVNPEYSGIAPFENDTIDYRGAVIVDGPGISMEEDGIWETDLVFQAEWKQ